ncbi:hypothetical protein ACJIZ3_016736 [Penstemon smallii]|uniref:Uncharacterized protein n=1 Tax=Penstemon smallii TaxID=265156 RepID=A0ABD3STK2_9LAMI
MSSSSPIFSPLSDKQFWNTLHRRIETLIENRKPPVDSSFITQKKEDSMLLLRGFDSAAQSLSQLSNNLENALKRFSSVSYIDQTEERTLLNEESKDEQKEEDNEEEMRGLKRKMDSENQGGDSKKAKVKSPQGLGKFKKAKCVGTFYWLFTTILLSNNDSVIL